MRNIWDNDEMGCLLLLPTALPAVSLCIVAKLTHILVLSLWIWPQWEGWGESAVILMMLWYLKDFFFVLTGHNSIAVVVTTAVSNFINTK